MQFFCDKCGECCRHISNIVQLASFDRGDGVCIHLKGCECEIYELRPDICNVEKMYEKVFSQAYTREAFYNLNKKACESLMKLRRLKIHSLSA